MTVTLPADLQAFVDEQVKTGRDPDVNAVLAEAVRALRLKREEEAKLAALRADIQLGLDDIAAGRVAPLDVMAILAEVEAKPVLIGEIGSQASRPGLGEATFQVAVPCGTNHLRPEGAVPTAQAVRPGNQP